MTYCLLPFTKIKFVKFDELSYCSYVYWILVLNKRYTEDDCDEGLCQDCTEHHSLSKATRNHKTISIAGYHKLPSFIANIKLHCDEHDEKYQLFCKKHNVMLCRKCVISENHVECKVIFPIEDVIQNAKTSVAFTEIASSFQEMKENLKLILEDRQRNVSSLSESKKN
ncbi:unnamed protein product [Mytilus coruscus]|uniref:B box-type domain-containing protein n=1 Tax=Mytilus coruscus TaxID=42192 RepID=A0A6J8BWA5_MYTCO|nr:unnamed protein product [Mytilus coruscus]